MIKSIKYCLVLVLFTHFKVSAAPIKDKYLEKRKWSVTQSRSFEILSDAKPSHVLRIAKQLERYKAFITLFLNIPQFPDSKENIKIIIAKNRKTWLAMGIPRYYATVFGADHTGQVRIITNLDQFVDDGLSAQFSRAWTFQGNPQRARILQALTFDMFRDTGLGRQYPLWCQHGYSYYLASYTEHKNKIFLGRFGSMSNRLRALIKDDELSKIRTKALLTAESSSDVVTSKEMKPHQHVYFGAASFLLVHYFNANKRRQDNLVAYLKLIKSGANEEQSLKKAMGLTFEELDDALYRYLHSKRYARTFNKFSIEDMMHIPTDETYSTRKINGDEFWQVIYPQLQSFSEGEIPQNDLQELYKKIKPRLSSIIR